MKHLLTAAFLAGACLLGAAQAQTYPNKPIRAIVPFAPGGTTDVLVRAMGQEMAAGLGQPVVVENKAGGGAVLGTAALAQAAPDGYTIGAIISSHAVNPGLHDKLPYDSANDFTLISMLVRLPIAIAVHPSHPARTIKEFIQYARDNPGKQVFGSPGAGTAGHLVGELINQQADVRMQHVPYKGGSQALQDLLAGHISASFHNTNIIFPHQKSGKVRVLAVTSAKRFVGMPDVPTVAEALPGFEVIEWYGMAGPKGMPRDVTLKLQREIVKVLASPTMKQRFPLEEGLELFSSTPEEFDTFLQAELKRWPPMVRRMGIKGE